MFVELNCYIIDFFFQWDSCSCTNLKTLLLHHDIIKVLLYIFRIYVWCLRTNPCLLNCCFVENKVISIIHKKRPEIVPGYFLLKESMNGKDVQSVSKSGRWQWCPCYFSIFAVVMRYGMRGIPINKRC